MFRKKEKERPNNLEQMCNYKLTSVDWALIDEAFAYATIYEFYFHEFIKSRNKDHKRIWKRFEDGRKEHGHELLGALFLRRNPETAKKICSEFKNLKS